MMIEFKNKLETTRKRLLDLTKKNKLINYKRPAKSRYLKIIDETPEFIYQHLVFNESPFKFKYIPEPEIPQIEYRKLEKKIEKIEKLQQNTPFQNEQKLAENQIKRIYEKLQTQESNALLSAEEQAKKLGFDISTELPDIDLRKSDVDEKYTDDYLQTLHYPDALERMLRKRRSDANSAIQEKGTNVLYLAIGFLQWKQSVDSEKILNEYSDFLVDEVETEEIINYTVFMLNKALCR